MENLSLPLNSSLPATFLSAMTKHVWQFQLGKNWRRMKMKHSYLLLLLFHPPCSLAVCRADGSQTKASTGHQLICLSEELILTSLLNVMLGFTQHVLFNGDERTS